MTEPEHSTPITLSVKGIDAQVPLTRAVITDETDKTLNKLSTSTDIFMVMKSEYVQLAAPNDFDGPHDTKYCVTAASPDDEGNLVFSSDRMRYWDDIHARCSNLSIWAITCPGLDYVGRTGTNQNASNIQFSSTNGLKSWQTASINATSIEWNVPHHGSGNYQDATSVKNRDLCYSNNIADYTGSADASIPDASKTDRRLKFNTDTRKFTSGEMVFYHALSKITININMGEGFRGNDDFRFTTGSSDATRKNVMLHYFNIWGRFNVETGLWTEVSGGHQVSKGMYDHMNGTPNITDNTKPTYQLEALVIPYLESDAKTTKGSLIDNSAVNAFVFSIDNIEYTVSRKTLLDALKANSSENGIASDATSVPMEQGKNYVFNFTVGKSRIDQITASITDWTTVTTGNLTPSNARITLMLEERGNQLDDGTQIAVYRSSESSSAYNWSTGYVGNANTLTKTSGNWGLSSVWFWPDNNTYYHFRTIMPKGETVKNDATAKVDYVELSSAVFGSYNDVCWGAPMLDNANDEDSGSFKWTYSFDNGFGVNNTALSNKNQIYPGIGATNGALKFTLFHAMSHINVRLTTSDDATAVLLKSSGEPAVTTYATVELLNYKDGRLLLGNGKIETKGGEKNTVITKKTDVFEYPFEVVPQNLTNVKLRITTPDNNVFIVDLKDAIADTSENSAYLTSNNIANPYTEVSTGKYLIPTWYPGFQYEYNINLTLKGIDKVGVKLVEWKNTIMDSQEIQIQ